MEEISKGLKEINKKLKGAMIIEADSIDNVNRRNIIIASARHDIIQLKKNLMNYIGMSWAQDMFKCLCFY